MFTKKSHRREKLGVAFVLGACLACVGCDDDDTDDIIDTRAAPNADFTAYETFAFVDPTGARGVGTNIPSSVTGNLAIVNDAMREELTELGLREVAPDQDPDLLAFNLSATDDEEAIYWSCVDGYWYGYWAWTSTPCDFIAPVYTEYTEGAILLGLVDRGEEEVVFSGLIRGVEDSSDDLDDRIEDDVERVFDAYPENQTGR